MNTLKQTVQAVCLFGLMALVIGAAYRHHLEQPAKPAEIAAAKTLAEQGGSAELFSLLMLREPEPTVGELDDVLSQIHEANAVMKEAGIGKGESPWDGVLHVSALRKQDDSFVACAPGLFFLTDDPEKEAARFCYENPWFPTKSAEAEETDLQGVLDLNAPPLKGYKYCAVGSMPVNESLFRGGWFNADTELLVQFKKIRRGKKNADRCG